MVSFHRFDRKYFMGFMLIASTAALNGCGNLLPQAKSSPIFLWSAPAAISYGTPLSATQLNAYTVGPNQSALGGSIGYSPAAGAVLAPGSYTLTATFTPSDPTTSAAVVTTTLTVNKAAPVVAWSAPASYVYGTALSSTQLNATATGLGGTSLPGTFTYSPAAGAVLTAGAQALTVSFTPTDATDYSTATAKTTLTVSKASPTVLWNAPSSIGYGTALSATQLDATANGIAGTAIPGTFTYSPAAGSLPGAGTPALSVIFTPTDTVDYTSASGATSLTVNKATPVLTWAMPSAIQAGTLLSATQLDPASTGVDGKSLPGTFVYSVPGAFSLIDGSLLPAPGAQQVTATFTPADAADYTSASKSVSVQVNAVNGFGALVGVASDPTVTPAVSVTPTPLGKTQEVAALHVRYNRSTNGTTANGPLWSGDSPGNDAIVTAGQYIVWTILSGDTSGGGVYPDPTVPSGQAGPACASRPAAVPSLLDTYLCTLGSMVDTYAPSGHLALLKLENEPAHTNSSYIGTAAQYIDQLNQAVSWLHTNRPGYPIASGAIIQRPLSLNAWGYMNTLIQADISAGNSAQQATDQAVADKFSKVTIKVADQPYLPYLLQDFVTHPAGTPNYITNPASPGYGGTVPAEYQNMSNDWRDGGTLIAGFKSIAALDYVDFHWYPGTAMATESDNAAAMATAAEFLRAQTGHPVINTENGGYSQDPALVTAMMTTAYNLGFPYFIYFDGDGGGGAVGLHDGQKITNAKPNGIGSLRATGTAYVNFITTNFP